MAETPHFKEKDIVLCFKKKHLFDCVIEAIDDNDPHRPLYLVHYIGYSDQGDEWVPAIRLRTITEESKRFQEDLFAQGTSKSCNNNAGATTATKGHRPNAPTNELTSKPSTGNGAESIQPESNGDAGESKKPGVMPGLLTLKEFEAKKTEKATKVSQVCLTFPKKIKGALHDDHDYVICRRMINVIPAPINVETIIEDFLQAREPPPSKYVTEASRGLVELFDAVLGYYLLYKPERPQYADILRLHPNTSLSKIYGSIFLLRCFVHITQSFHFFEPEEKVRVQNVFNEILTFLEKNHLKYLGSYEKTTPDYYRRTRFYK